MSMKRPGKLPLNEAENGRDEEKEKNQVPEKVDENSSIWHTNQILRFLFANKTI